MKDKKTKIQKSIIDIKTKAVEPINGRNCIGTIFTKTCKSISRAQIKSCEVISLNVKSHEQVEGKSEESKSINHTCTNRHITLL